MKMLLALATVACTVSCAAPAPSRPTLVYTPVVIPCKAEEPKCGPYPLTRVKEEDRLIVKWRAALAELSEREACEAQLRAALRVCTGSPQ